MLYRPLGDGYNVRLLYKTDGGKCKTVGTCQSKKEGTYGIKLQIIQAISG